MIIMEKIKSHPLYREDLQNILSVKSIKSLQGKRVLITGSTGMIGVMLIDSLMLLGGVEIFAVGRDQEKARTRLGEYFEKSNFHFVLHDVIQPFSQDIKVDYIIPLASNTHPLAYSEYPIETMLINIEGAKNALELACRCGATVLYPSTVEVYGNSVDGKPFKEEVNGHLNLGNSRACYTESKRASEALCQSYKHQKNVKVKIARLCRVFGPTMLLLDTKVSSQFIVNALNDKNIILKSEGNQYFSYIYVADAVASLLCVLLNGEIGEVYNVSSSKTAVYLKDFAKYTANIAGNQVVYELPKEQEKNGYSIATTAILDNSKLLALGGYNPKYTIINAIERTISMLK